MNKKLTLFAALQLIGFKKTAPRTLSNEKITISLRIGYSAHWYINGKDYQSQSAALHALVLWRFINDDDLKKLAEFDFDLAKEELKKLKKTKEKAKKISRKTLEQNK